MELTPHHRETLAELINIGYGRAAASLSELTGQRIVLEAPQVEVYSIERVKPALQDMLNGQIASVHQVFSGPVSGHALLLLDTRIAEMLTALVVRQDVPPEQLRVIRREALTEVGNIILQAAMGICGNLLKVHVSFSVPSLHLESVDDVLNSVVVNEVELQFALLVRTRFQLAASEVSGYLAVILGVTSFSRLLNELDKWEREVTANN
jgi:chemotaxis protein CheC